MKERPILFSGPMVRAILEGRKTQTRRVMKPQPPEWVEKFGYTAFTPFGHISGRGLYKHRELAEKFFKLPYGQPCDRLWVRESFRVFNGGDGTSGIIYKADHQVPAEGIWKPSIYMPRWAARITLEIVKVRIERIQDISERDAESEGVTGIPRSRELYPTDDFVYPFRSLWNSINEQRGFGWDKNPWVWVIEFKVDSKRSTINDGERK
jgi:hypothetical protein